MLGPLLDVNGPNGVLVSLVAIGAVRSLMVIRFTVGDSVWLRGDGKIYGSAPASSKYELRPETWTRLMVVVMRLAVGPDPGILLGSGP